MDEPAPGPPRPVPRTGGTVTSLAPPPARARVPGCAGPGTAAWLGAASQSSPTAGSRLRRPGPAGHDPQWQKAGRREVAGSPATPRLTLGARRRGGKHSAGTIGNAGFESRPAGGPGPGTGPDGRGPGSPAEAITVGRAWDRHVTRDSDRIMISITPPRRPGQRPARQRLPRRAPGPAAVPVGPSHRVWGSSVTSHSRARVV